MYKGVEMKFFKKLLLAIILLPCTFMFTACLNSEPNVYLVDVVFETVGDETICTYIYSNGYEKTKTIKNQGDITKSIVNISKSLNNDNLYNITYSDGTTSQITIGNEDKTVSITKFEKKSESDNIYIITYSDDSTDEITIDQNDITTVISITKTPGNNATYTITYSDGSTSEIPIGGDEVNSIIDFKKKSGSDSIYAITYEDGTTEEVTIISSNTTAEDYYNNKVIDTYNNVINSAVIIHSSITNNDEYINTGSGVIYSMDKSTGGKTYIITNHHVVADELTASGLADTITVFPFGSNLSLTATCIGSSESIDIAVLAVDTQTLLTLNQYCYVPDIAEYRVLGDTAIAVGNPNSQGLTITSGRVSLNYTYKYFDDEESERLVFGLDTPLNPGNSGGGIFNLDGQLIGIVEGGAPNLDNIAYAIPIELVESLVENIIDQYDTVQTYSKAKKILLGFKASNLNSRAEKDANGISKSVIDFTITEIGSTGLAYTKFNLRQNDILNEIIINGNSFKIDQTYNLDVYLLYIRAGDTVKFKYTRGETTYTSPTYTIQSSDITAIIE